MHRIPVHPTRYQKNADLLSGDIINDEIANIPAVVVNQPVISKNFRVICGFIFKD